MNRRCPACQGGARLAMLAPRKRSLRMQAISHYFDAERRGAAYLAWLQSL